MSTLEKISVPVTIGELNPYRIFKDFVENKAFSEERQPIIPPIMRDSHNWF